MLPHPLTNFEIQKCYQNVSRFHEVYSRNNLLKIKDWIYLINLDEYGLRGTHWIALYLNGDNVTYFDTFAVKYIKKQIKEVCRTKILKQIFLEYKHRIQ